MATQKSSKTKAAVANTGSIKMNNKANSTSSEASNMKTGAGKLAEGNSTTSKSAGRRMASPLQSKTTAKSMASKSTANKAAGSESGGAKPVATKSTASKPSTSKPSTSKSSTDKSSTGKSSTAKSSTSKPSTSKSSTGKSSTAKSSTSKSDASKSAGNKPNASKAASKVQSKDGGKSDSAEFGKAELVSKKDASTMMRLLCELYPDADCELTFKNDFELLTAVILSAQTTDVQVNKVTPALFTKFPTPEALASANIEDVKDLIKPTGYYNNKANSIQSCAHALVTKFNGKVPKTLEELITLPGVGRKTANVVLGVVHKIPGWTVDTHVQRLSNRLGLTSNTDPYKIELDLQKLFPEQDWTQYSITLIWHGRRLCFARNPDCPACPLKHLCPSSLAP